MKAKLKRKHQAGDDTISKLAQLYPRAFFVFEMRRRPLKVGIHNDLMAVLPWRVLRYALMRYTGNTAYLRALRTGVARVDLQGNVVGTVTADEAAQAQLRLATRKQPTPRSKPQLAATALASWQAHKQKKKQAPAPTQQRKSTIRVWRS